MPPPKTNDRYGAVDNCAKPEPIRSRQYKGGPDIEFVTVNFPNAANAGLIDRDILVQFNRPWKLIGVASIDHTFIAANIFIHFVQLGLSTAGPGNAIVPTGSERWIPLSNQLASTAKAEARWIRFCDGSEVKQFYVDADHQAGVQAGGYNITFFGTNDIQDMVPERQ